MVQYQFPQIRNVCARFPFRKAKCHIVKLFLSLICGRNHIKRERRRGLCACVPAPPPPPHTLTHATKPKYKQSSLSQNMSPPSNCCTLWHPHVIICVCARVCLLCSASTSLCEAHCTFSTHICGILLRLAHGIEILLVFQFTASDIRRLQG